ncbi:SHD1 domain-containing protein, partial [bacterium]|nr:SHD1 domain-containing protein [bacterium]
RPVAPQMRTWSDTTGQFKIEATFIELKGDSITLKRKDGKVISLPIAKLSEPDQKHIKEMAQPKAVNPFE